jgi:hypothetical protein
LSDPRINALVKLRDSHQMAVDALTEYLEALAPPGTPRAAAPAAGTGKGYDIEKIRWEDATGDKGPFQKSSDANSPDFKALLQDVQAHKGKLTAGGFFIWVFQDGVTLGRKKRSF